MECFRHKRKGEIMVVTLLTVLAVALSPASAPSYSSCDQAAQDGRYDIPESDPAYRTSLDRDDDGIACESTN